MTKITFEQDGKKIVMECTMDEALESISVNILEYPKQVSSDPKIMFTDELYVTLANFLVEKLAEDESNT